MGLHMYNLKQVRQFMTHLLSIFSPRCLLLSAAAVLATMVSMMMGWTADYPMALIGTAVIFPIVFSINSAYQRREEALGHYAHMKANLRSIYFILRTWKVGKENEAPEVLQKNISAPLFAVRQVITEPIDDLRKNEPEIYLSFANLAAVIEERAELSKVTGAQESVCRTYLNNVMEHFEELKHIFQYRTPRALQAFSDVFITVLPILYAPVFAAIALSIDNYYLAFLVPALFAFVLSSLDNIQADLEDPFDGIGVDDIVINAEVFVDSLTHHCEGKAA
ncbi:hypothetical protein ACJ3XI_11680 [Litorimonas sp. RW-G-Af-16]|uniref:hypothetical protein n=1 Tax=Litorimonas sp. RW-G-Af-16 TaxID=3241168 RepID=UPI00390C9F14